MNGGANATMAGWMNRQQQEAVEYLRTENRIVREKLGCLFKNYNTDDEQER